MSTTYRRVDNLDKDPNTIYFPNPTIANYINEYCMGCDDRISYYQPFNFVTMKTLVEWVTNYPNKEDAIEHMPGNLPVNDNDVIDDLYEGTLEIQENLREEVNAFLEKDKDYNQYTEIWYVGY